MRGWRVLTVGDVLGALSRYRPLVAILVGVFLLAVFAPGTVSRNETTATGGLRGTSAQPGEDREPFEDATGEFDTDSSPGNEAGGATGAAAPAGRRPGSGVSGPALRPPPSPLADEALKAVDCDASRGQVKVPMMHVPSCVPMWPKGADNGGATYRGVTRDEITVAVREIEPNPAVQAALVAAGVNEDPNDIKAVRQEFIDLFHAHYETYGRKVKLVYFKPSGNDDQAQRADAIRVATEIKAFAVMDAFAPSVFVDELAARGIIAITPRAAGTAPLNYYLERAPYLWSHPPSTENTFIHVAEFLGKRVHGRNAKWAGDASFQSRRRSIGLVYQDTDGGAFAAAVKFFERELSRYGAKLDIKLSYVPDTARAQEISRTLVARLKEAGITTVVFAGDFLTPSFLTQEATRQIYFPEWVVTGMFLTDSVVFARTYDQQQWSHAFGLSSLPVKSPLETKPCDIAYQWHYGQTYRTSGCGGIFEDPNNLMRGIHMAGPKLTPQTFRDGLFAMKPTGGSAEGAVTVIGLSFGSQGYWAFDDYTAVDDLAEVWWDPNAFGRDELNNEGRGMYVFADGGTRYVPGRWPAAESRAFVREGSVVSYGIDDLPPADRLPVYEHMHYRNQ